MRLTKIALSVYLFLVCFTAVVYAAGPITVDIPFSFKNDTESAHECTVIIEPVGDAPQADAQKVIIPAGGSGSFSVTLERPGISVYKVYQQKGGHDEVEYDSTVYTVTLTASSDSSSGTLIAAVTAEIASGEKSEVIRFTNRERSSGANSETAKGEGSGTGNETAKSEGSGKSSSLNRLRPQGSSTGTDTAENSTVSRENPAEDTTEEQAAVKQPYGETETDTVPDEQTADRTTDTAPEEQTADKAKDSDRTGNTGTSTDNNSTAPKNDPDNNSVVDTGDRNRQELPMLGMVVSAAVFTGSAMAEKKQKNTNKKQVTTK